MYEYHVHVCATSLQVLIKDSNLLRYDICQVDLAMEAESLTDVRI